MALAYDGSKFVGRVWQVVAKLVSKRLTLDAAFQAHADVDDHIPARFRVLNGVPFRIAESLLSS